MKCFLKCIRDEKPDIPAPRPKYNDCDVMPTPGLNDEALASILCETAAFCNVIFEANFYIDTNIVVAVRLANASRFFADCVSVMLEKRLRDSERNACFQSTYKIHIPRSIMTVMVRWIADCAQNGADFSGERNHNIIVCFMGAKACVARHRIVNDYVQQVETCLDHDTHLTETGTCIANMSSCVPDCLTNMPSCAPESLTNMSSRAPDSQAISGFYFERINTFYQDTTKKLDNIPSGWYLDDCRRVSKYAYAVNRNSKHRTIPVAIVESLNFLLQYYSTCTMSDYDHMSSYILALESVIECCGVLDMFSPQLCMVLDIFSWHLKKTRDRGMLRYAVYYLELWYSTSVGISCTRSWFQNFESYIQCMSVCLNIAQKMGCTYTEFKTIMGLVQATNTKCTGISRQVSVLAVHLIWNKSAVGQLDFTGLYSILDNLPENLLQGDLVCVILAGLRASERRYCPETSSTVDIWYMSLVLKKCLACIPLSVIRGRSSLRRAFKVNLDHMVKLFFNTNGHGPVFVDRITFYLIDVIKDLVRAGANLKRGSRCVSYFMPQSLLNAIFGVISSESRFLTPKTGHCVLLPLFHIVFSMSWYLNSSDSQCLFREIPMVMMESWFKHYEVIKLSPLLYLNILVAYAEANAEATFILNHCAFFAKIDRPARVPYIVRALKASHKHTGTAPILRIIAGMSPEPYGPYQPWTPETGSLVARIAHECAAESGESTDLHIITQACVASRSLCNEKIQGGIMSVLCACF